MIQFISLVLSTAFTTAFAVTSVIGADWSVPLAGNTFLSQPELGHTKFNADGFLRLNDPEEVYSVYVHVSRPGKIQIAIRGRASKDGCQLKAVVGSTVLKTELQDQAVRVYPFGEIDVVAAGYLRVDLQFSQRDNSAWVEVNELLVTTQVDGLSLDYVKNNEGNMFYWGRRGPSVHLSYHLPEGKQITYAYSEITVPDGRDPVGAYFMANGFTEGYFGIQVNSANERRVLFSVWSPFRTDNPAEIPAEDRIVIVAKGDGVKGQDFGNEGSGGQSYLDYSWKAGVTYRFLTEVKPDGKGNTLYTSWFGDKQADEWQLIASFRRPRTDKHLTGFHSFLENFAPDRGNLQRSARYGNQWVCDVNGEWHEITQAKFTGDNTARGRHRLDYAGGIVESAFFLKNCGFFSDQVSLDQTFERNTTKTQKPDIDFDQLPRR